MPQGRVAEPLDTSMPSEVIEAMAAALIQLPCEGCGNTVSFPASVVGSVQECPECGGYVDVPELTRTYTPEDEHSKWYERQLREIDRQHDQYARQLEQAARQLDLRDELDARSKVILGQVVNLVGRWEALAGRFERALDKLER